MVALIGLGTYPKSRFVSFLKSKKEKDVNYEVGCTVGYSFHKPFIETTINLLIMLNLLIDKFIVNSFYKKKVVIVVLSAEMFHITTVFMQLM